MGEMKVAGRLLSEITPYENNPRINDHAVDYVANSISAFGFKVPIVIDKNNVIVTGHTRYKAAVKLGMKEIPCVIADDLTEEQIRAFRIADNKTAEIADWDYDLLQMELDKLPDFDMSDFGFDNDFEEDSPAPAARQDDYDIEKAIDTVQTPHSKRGEIYQLGCHRLMCGDSSSINDIKKLMDGKAAAMLLTDPPYNVDYEGGTEESLKMANDHMSSEKFRSFLAAVFKGADSVMQPGGAFYIWYASREHCNVEGACNDIGWTVRQQLIWVKNSLVLSRQDYHWRHEPCQYGWKEGAAHKWLSDRTQTTVLEFDRPTKNDKHPTMKPVPLFDYLMRNSSAKGDIVLDLFGGSGTSIIAAEQNGRICYTMEYDPRYVDVIIERWEALSGKKAVLINGA